MKPSGAANDGSDVSDPAPDPAPRVKLSVSTKCFLGILNCLIRLFMGWERLVFRWWKPLFHRLRYVVAGKAPVMDDWIPFRDRPVYDLILEGYESADADQCPFMRMFGTLLCIELLERAYRSPLSVRVEEELEMLTRSEPRPSDANIEFCVKQLEGIYGLLAKHQIGDDVDRIFWRNQMRAINAWRKSIQFQGFGRP